MVADRSSCVPTGALQIESSEESDQGKYECVATNSAGTRYSAPANLYVRGKKLATPGSVTLEPNFTCQALLLGDLGADTGGTPQASPFLPTSFCSSAHATASVAPAGQAAHSCHYLPSFPSGLWGSRHSLHPHPYPWEHLYLL